MKPRQHWAPPAPLDGWQDRVGAWVVGVLLLALPAQRQEQELEAVPGEQHKESRWGWHHTRGPEPPHQGGTVLVALYRCHLQRVSLPLPAPLPGWGVQPMQELGLGVPSAVGELAPVPMAAPQSSRAVQ